MAALDRVLEAAQRRREEVEAGQGALFVAGAGRRAAARPRRAAVERRRAAARREGGAGLLPDRESARRSTRPGSPQVATATTADVKEGLATARSTIGGIVTRLRRSKIKSGPNAGRMMGRFVLEDLHGSLPVALFADQMQRFGGFIADEAVVLVKGTVRDRGAELELTVEEVAPLEQAVGKMVTRVELEVLPRSPRARCCACATCSSSTPGRCR